MKIKAYIAILFTGIVFLTACQKNIDIFVPDPGQLNGPDSSWHTIITATMPVSVLKSSLLESTYTDSIVVNGNTVSIVIPGGLLISFPPNSCVTSVGLPVSGKVDVDIQLVNKKGSMIRQNKPSITFDSLLVTAAQFYIKLKKDGQSLQLAPNVKLNLRYLDSPINPQMNFFVGDENGSGIFNWLPNPDTANNKIYPGSQAYEIFSKQLGWISASYGYSLNNNATVYVSADMANYFTNANTLAFTVFKDLNSVVVMKGDLSTRKFITGKLPAGKQITVVVISKQGGDYYLGYSDATTLVPTSGGTTQPVLVVPIKKSLPQILSYLSSL